MIIKAGSAINANGDEYQCRQAVVHPDYNSVTVDYDVSVLEIVGHFDAASNQMPIPLTTATSFEPLVGLEALVTGFGRTSVSSYYRDV